MSRVVRASSEKNDLFVKATPQSLTSSPPKMPWREGLIAAGTLALIVMAIYGRTAAFDFIQYDDQVYVSENPLVLYPSKELLTRIWVSPREGVYIPLAYTAYTAIGRMAEIETPTGATGVDAGPFHLASMLVHLACSWLVWLLVWQLFRNQWGAVAAGLLFACHPFQVESVAWVSGFSGQLGALFSLLALWLFLRAIQEWTADKPVTAKSRKMALGLYGLSSLVFTAALLSKPQAVTLPLIAALVAALWYKPSWRLLVALLGPWLLLGAVIALITAGTQSEGTMEFISPWWSRPFIAGDAIAFYLTKLLWPLNLGPDHGRIPRVLLNGPWVYVAWLIPASVVLAGIVLRAGKSFWVAVGIFVFAVLPVLGLIPFAHQDISTVADRYVYFAMLGPAVAVGAWFSVSRGSLQWICAGVLLVIFSALSFNQAGQWHNTETLVDHALAINNRSGTMRGVKAEQLQREGLPQEALEQLEMAVEKQPDSASAHYRLAVWYLNHRQYDEARESISNALQLQPNQPRMMTTLGKVYWGEGDFERALGTLQKAVATAPSDSMPRMALAQLLGRLGRIEEATAQYELVVELAPENVEAATTLGTLLAAQGDLGRAEELCRRAVALAPDSNLVHADLGSILLNRGDYDGAVQEYAIALELGAGEEARINLGIALLQSGRLNEAEQQLTRAVKKLPESADAHYNLAAVLLRQGRNEEARELLERSLKLNPDHQPARIQLEALQNS